MQGVAGGGRGLYDTIVAATQAASSQSAAGAPNTAVVVTAGPNDDDFGASLGEVKSALSTTSTSDTSVRLVIIGVGDKPNATILTEVAEATGGAYLAATSADQLSEAVGSALAGRP